MAGRVADRTAQYDETRERIIDTSAHLFAQNGYAATGVAELGEAVNLARGALYYYIKSKDALLSAIHDRVMDPLLTGAADVFRLNVTAPARLVLMSELLLRLIVEHADHVWVFLHEHRQLQGDERAKFRAKREEFEKYISDLIAEGVDDGLFDVEDLRLATLTWLNVHNHTYHWVATEPDVSVERLSQFYSRTLLKGFSASDISFAELKKQVDTGRDELRAAGDHAPA